MIENRLHRPGRGNVGEHDAPAAARTGEHVRAEDAQGNMVVNIGPSLKDRMDAMKWLADRRFGKVPELVRQLRSAGKSWSQVASEVRCSTRHRPFATRARQSRPHSAL
jgi:hypothetical protein